MEKESFRAYFSLFLALDPNMEKIMGIIYVICHAHLNLSTKASSLLLSIPFL